MDRWADSRPGVGVGVYMEDVEARRAAFADIIRQWILHV
jgi:hypothetical protein